MDYATLPQRIREIANLSEFSRRSGVPRRTLVRIASGGSNPNLETLNKIAEALRTLRPKKRQRMPEQEESRPPVAEAA